MHIVASTMPKRWVAAAAREVIAIDGFRVASMMKRSSKRVRGTARSGKCLPETQERLAWRRFLDGCPCEQTVSSGYHDKAVQ